MRTPRTAVICASSSMTGCLPCRKWTRFTGCCRATWRKYGFISIASSAMRLHSMQQRATLPTWIARDDDAKLRYLQFLHASDRPAVRARMIALAGELDWLTPDQKRAELLAM